MKKTLYISGMHCPSCDLLIRETIKETPDVALVSLTSTWVLTCIFHDDTAVSTLKEAISAHGYTVSDSPNTPDANKKPRRKDGVILLCSWILIWRILSTVDITSYAASLWTDWSLGYWEVFLLWIIASLSTCLALVWWFILMWWSLQWTTSLSLRDSIRHQVLFRVGRLWWYALWWVLLWLLWSVIIFSPSVNGIINLVVSILLLFIWRNMLQLVTINFPVWWWWNHLVKTIKSFSLKRRWGVIVGALTFFLPCGFSQLAQINALSTWSPLQWALLLFFFALWTLPVLFILWLTGDRFQTNQSSFLNKILWVLLIVLSLFLIQNALHLLWWF